MNSRIKKDQVSFILFLSPLLFVMFTLFIYPILRVITMSFYSIHPVYGTQFIGWDGYAEVFADPIFGASILRTFLYMCFVVFFNVFLGTGLALLTEKSSAINRILRVVFIVPILFIPSASAVIWGFMLNEDIGLINNFLRTIGLPTKMWLAFSDSGFPAVMTADIWGWTPFVYLMLLSGLQSLPTEPYESARVDGAGALRIFFSITVPLLKPVLVTTVIIKSLDTFRNFTYMWIMTRGGPADGTHTLSTYIYANAFNLFRYGKGSTMGVIAIILGFMVAFGLYRLLKGGREAETA